MSHCHAYDCLMVSRKTKGISFCKFQANSQRRIQAVTTNELRISLTKTTSKLLKSLGLDNLENPHRPKLKKVMQYQPRRLKLRKFPKSAVFRVTFHQG